MSFIEERWSAKKLLKYLQLAVEGKYTAQNYKQYEIDLTILLYELSGGGSHKLVPCVGGLKLTDISDNITDRFGPHHVRDSTSVVKMTPTLCGHTMLFDELVLEHKIDYLPGTDDMAGFCLEHLKELEMVKVGKDVRTVETAITAV
ncbi:hypothetical protein B0H10DRAFT_1965433 [Mycena sp. CBHHK59/15]|nr:hypothetical protein B0H10DRAFT_1965433 [Mycena sp. CBHHK59/15]